MGLIRDYLRYRKARKAWSKIIFTGALFTNEENSTFAHVNEAWEKLTMNRPWIIRWIN